MRGKMTLKSTGNCQEKVNTADIKTKNKDMIKSLHKLFPPTSCSSHLPYLSIRFYLMHPSLPVSL